MTFTILLFDSGVCLPFDNSNANLKKFFIASNTELEKKNTIQTPKNQNEREQTFSSKH